ncbi:hypothetical protein A3J34_01535 [Candidatus Peribacteria bacterium RIFCSPLOWO2_02_FULL_51_10]|nr:MAG: hypothetical protein A3J34_01535 [Candidatus Peribacteria bacterium RIFCSPLOWO2_02_FULL_51_10]
MQQSPSFSTGSTVRTTPKDVFLHLLAIITLYMSVSAIIMLLFSCINLLMPDPLAFYYSDETDAIRISTAILIVGFPVYLVLMRLINRDIAAEPGKTAIGARKWLMYLTIFLSAILIIIDAITLLYNFLNGELTLRFFLKVLVVLIVAGAVFGFYIKEARRSGMMNLKVWAYGSSAAVLLSIVAGFLVAGSPWHQRAVRFDEQRVNYLQTIQNETVSFWQRKERLPENLDELTDSISGFKAPVDPDTGKPYKYRVQDKLSFSLCADFKTESRKDLQGKRTPASLFGEPDQNWTHGIGSVCFERTIDPALYKNPNVKPVR